LTNGYIYGRIKIEKGWGYMKEPIAAYTIGQLYLQYWLNNPELKLDMPYPITNELSPRKLELN